MSTLPRISLLLFCLGARQVTAQRLELPAGALASDSSIAAAMPNFAARLLDVYREPDRDRYLDNLFRIQIVARRYDAALSSLQELKERRRSPNAARVPETNLLYEIYTAARQREAAAGALDQAFKAAFRDKLRTLDDKTAAVLVPWVFGTRLDIVENDFRRTITTLAIKSDLTVPESVDLVRKYLSGQVLRLSTPLFPALQTEDDERRYFVDRDVRVKIPDGATICTLIVRPRAATRPLTTLLEFTIYADSANNMAEARRSASHGYAGVEGLSRGKYCSSNTPMPIEHDGADGAALIDWISRQPWSDGRVGTFGGSYNGFTQWAAAKHMPKALKAMMPSVTFAPGIDFPMDGNIYMNYAHPWPFYTTNVKGLDSTTYSDSDRWERRDQEWYKSGRAYRELDKIDGTPNPIWQKWISHPSYDAYWQSAIPYRDEFARIRIPVLTTTGYYDGGQMGALYYFTQHYLHNPAAEHYLVIGPYDHVGGQRGTITPTGAKLGILRGYPIDSAAHIDIGELRYQWFDYVFRNAPRPSLLGDKVNYEVMDANEWRHAPSIAAMGQPMRMFYLDPGPKGSPHVLTEVKPARKTQFTQSVDLANRDDAKRWATGGDLIDQALDGWNITSDAPHIGNAVEFVSQPFDKPVEISGLFSGELAFVTNKKDFDVGITLFELTPKGEYLQLSYHWMRVSYAADRSRRRLLTPGKPERIQFRAGRLTSRRFAAGSRLVVVLGVIKQPGEEINYGTGGTVTDETIAAALEPLGITWSSDGFVRVPLAVVRPRRGGH